MEGVDLVPFNFQFVLSLATVFAEECNEFVIVFVIKRIFPTALSRGYILKKPLHLHPHLYLVHRLSSDVNDEQRTTVLEQGIGI